MMSSNQSQLPFEFNPVLSPEQRRAATKVIQSINDGTYDDVYVNNFMHLPDGTVRTIVDPVTREDVRFPSAGPVGAVPRRCVVTGGTGFVGMRLVEMLIERGAEQVISFDIVDKAKLSGAWDHPRIKWVVGDVCNYEQVRDAVRGADCVWHLAAAVGPFHPRWLFEKVNHQGTVNIVKACIKEGVRRFVYSSSPSTRFKGDLFHRPCVDGLTEAQMPQLPLDHYMQGYAEGKANGEMYVTSATLGSGGTLLATSVAPHQVYGPRDNLFLPNMLEAAGTGKLRIFGNGQNRICFTHNDNYAHSLIIAERQLYEGSPVIGKFYVATDAETHTGPDAYCIFWKELDRAITGVGFRSIWSLMKIPFFFIYAIALLAEFVAFITGVTFKLNVFNVFVLTMHRWFKIDAIKKDMNYRPIISFKDGGWEDTIEWFKVNWLPLFKKQCAKKHGLGGISAKSQEKIDEQKKKTKRN